MEKLEQIITTYQQIIQKTELELQNARKRFYYISLLRLILFVGAVANAIIFWSDGWLCLSVFAILPFILFIWLVKRHNFWFYRKDFLKKKIEINEQELRAMQYDFSDFDDGKEFINPSHLYTLDLDVFGEHSLFQYINAPQPLSASNISQTGSMHIWRIKQLLTTARKPSGNSPPIWNIANKSAYSDYSIKENLPIPPKSKNGQPVRVIIENVRSCVSSQ